MPVVRLTDLFCRSVRANDDGRNEWTDDVVRGLSLRINRNATKTWSLKYLVRGEQARITLGHYPETSLALARTRAIEIKSQAEAGEDPRDVKRGCPRQLKDMTGLTDITEEVRRRCGIYFLCKNGEIRYVGQSTHAAARVWNHQRTRDFDKIYFLPCAEDDLNRLESALIQALQPPENVRGVITRRDHDRDVVRSAIHASARS